MHAMIQFNENEMAILSRAMLLVIEEMQQQVEKIPEDAGILQGDLELQAKIQEFLDEIFES